MKRAMILAVLVLAAAAGLVPSEAEASGGSRWEPRPPRAAVAAVRG